MNRQEAKVILELYRPGGQDASDPQFAAALAMVERDPQLAQWLADQQAFDTAMSTDLKAIPVPAQLKTAILAQWQPAAAPAQHRRHTWLDTAVAMLRRPVFSERRILTSPFWRHWQPRAALVMGFVLLAAAVGAWYTHKPETFARYREEVVNASWDASRHLDLASPDLTLVRTWLTQQTVKGNFVLPSALSNAPLVGARVVEWRGHKAAFLCFADGARHLHLFIGVKDEFSDEPKLNEPQFENAEGWKSMSWTQGNHTYILTGMKYSTFVKKFRKAHQWDFGS